MLTCAICHCTDEAACVDVDGEPCEWFERETPMCSRCADNTAQLVGLLTARPCSYDQLVENLTATAREEVTRALAIAIERGVITFDGRTLAAPPAPPPRLALVATIGDCEVWSPGTFTVGEGWGPLDPILAATMVAASAPQVDLPFYAAPKEPS